MFPEEPVVAVSVSLVPEDLKVIGHSINWQLNGDYEHTPRPKLSEQEAETLSRLLTDLIGLTRVGASSVPVEIGDPYLCEPDRLRLPPPTFRLMAGAVASFFGEL